MTEPLLFKEFCSIVISICAEVLNSLLLGMIFQTIHQSGTQAAHLLRGCDGQKNYLSELLSAEWSKNATSQDVRTLSRRSSHNDHGLMLTIHGKFNDVIAWHAWKLLSDNVLQLNQIPHRL